MHDPRPAVNAAAAASGRSSPLAWNAPRAIGLAAILMLALIWTVAFQMARNDRALSIDGVTTGNANLARAFEEHTIRTLDGVDQSLRFLRQSYEKDGGSLDFAGFVSRVAGIGTVLVQIGVADAHGNVILNSQPLAEPVNIGDREHFRAHVARDTGLPHIGVPVIGRVSGKQTIQMSRRINAPDGAFAGTVVASIDPLYLAGFYRQVSLGPGSVVNLVGTDGIVRARAADGDGSAGQDIRGSDLFRIELPKAPHGSHRSIGRIDGVPRIFSYRTVRGYPLVVSVGSAEAHALAASNERRAQYFLSAGVASAVVLFAAAWLILQARQRRLAAAALRQSEARYRALADTSPDAILVNHQGRIAYINDAGVRLFGAEDRGQMLGRMLQEFVHPDSLASVRARFAAIVDRGETAPLMAQRYLRVDGAPVDVEVAAAPVAHDGARAAQLVIRDITERKRAEEALRSSNTALVHKEAALIAANKELEAFAYSVSHDLRAPLRHVDGFIAMLDRHIGPTLDAKGRHYLDRIAAAAQRMGGLIDDLLAFSRAGRSELAKRTVPLDRLVAEVVKEAAAHATGRSIDWNIGPLPAVSGDPALLRLVFVNLVDNAVKYSGTRNPARIEIGIREPAGREVVVFVRDNGVGFDMKYANKLFGVFQRLHRAEEFAGTGIGLATVQRIVQRHGGRVWADAAPDRGATFCIALTAAAEAVAA
jgi:PAS domain S-box-containing protein